MGVRIRDHANRLHEPRNEEGAVAHVEFTCDVPLLQRSGLARAVAIGVVLGLLLVGVYTASALLWVAGAFILIWAISALGLSNRRADFVNMTLAQRHCPVCGYALADTRPDDRGLTVCPECSAAWRVNPPDPADEPEA